MSVHAKKDKQAAAEKKAVNLEQMYQRKTPVEHVLLRPDSYVGSSQPTTQALWVYDSATKRMVRNFLILILIDADFRFRSNGSALTYQLCTRSLMRYWSTPPTTSKGLQLLLHSNLIAGWRQI